MGGDGYQEAEEVGVDRLEPGDLVLVDEAVGRWAVVEMAEPDILDDGCVCVDWRADGDELGSMSLPADSVVTARRPLDT